MPAGSTSKSTGNQQFREWLIRCTQSALEATPILEPETERIIRRIARYLVRHPDAADTLEGIGQWWLSDGGPMCSTAQLNKAVSHLVAMGWLSVKRPMAAHELYVANKELLAQIRTFVETDRD